MLCELLCVYVTRALRIRTYVRMARIRTYARTRGLGRRLGRSEMAVSLANTNRFNALPR